MNPIKAIYCRTVQAVRRAALPVLPYREPEIFRSCAELHTVFTKKEDSAGADGHRRGHRPQRHRGTAGSRP